MLSANNPEHEIKLEAQEYNFQEWNRKMRIQLEQLFRYSFTLSIAFIIQGIMIVAINWQYLFIIVKVYTVLASIFLVLESWVSYSLLQIKVKDMRREWRREKNFMFQGQATTQTEGTVPLENNQFMSFKEKRDNIEIRVKKGSLYSK